MQLYKNNKRVVYLLRVWRTPFRIFLPPKVKPSSLSSISVSVISMKACAPIPLSAKNQWCRYDGQHEMSIPSSLEQSFLSDLFSLSRQQIHHQTLSQKTMILGGDLQRVIMFIGEIVWIWQSTPCQEPLPWSVTRCQYTYLSPRIDRGLIGNLT